MFKLKNYIINVSVVFVNDEKCSVQTESFSKNHNIFNKV